MNTDCTDRLRYLVIYEKTQTGWSAYVDFHLEGMKLHGDPLSQPSALKEYVSVGV